MTRFAHFVLVLVVVGSAVALAVVFTRSRMIAKGRDAAIAADQKRMEEVTTRVRQKLRRADVLVEWQKVSGKGEAIETSLFFRSYTVDAKNEYVPTPFERILTAGDKIYVDAVMMRFSPQVRIEGGNFLAGASLGFFDRIYGSGDGSDEERRRTPVGGVPPGFRQNPERASYAELQLWNTLWGFYGNPAEAAKRGVKVTKLKSEAFTVKPGRAYQVWLGDTLLIDVVELTDPEVFPTLYREAMKALGDSPNR